MMEVLAVDPKQSRAQDEDLHILSPALFTTAITTTSEFNSKSFLFCFRPANDFHLFCMEVKSKSSLSDHVMGSRPMEASGVGTAGGDLSHGKNEAITLVNVTSQNR